MGLALAVALALVAVALVARALAVVVLMMRIWESLKNWLKGLAKSTSILLLRVFGSLGERLKRKHLRR
eukprot:g76856.t1